MTDEIKTQNEQKNTVATIGMWFSIIWLVLTITLFFVRLGMPLLFLWFILWIVGLFYRPRKKAWIAVSIPLVVFIALAAIVCYIWSSVKTPATQFWDWAKVNLEQLDDETFDNDRFNSIANEEFNNTFSSITEEDFKSLMETSTWSNTLEKWAYVFFGLLQQGLENTIEKYNNELPEVDEDNAIENEDENNEEDNSEEVELTEQEVTVESNEEESSETFSQSEKNDIEQIIDILE